MQITIIIDRFGNTNIYNVIEGNTINNPVLSGNQKLTSIVDDDLMAEYLHELNRISNVAISLTGLSETEEKKQAFIHEHLNLYEKIKQMGEVFYRQLIPEALRHFLQDHSENSLFLHVDESLAPIPFEILNDGNHFLWQKFQMGKTVKGKQGRVSHSEPLDSLKMIIIADPTEDLEWARIEGESLLEQLSVLLPEKKLQIELLGGRGASKLTLLNAIKDKQIVHYAGHLHYGSDPMENGWVLYNNKVLHAREIYKSGAQPLLIFSNSCVSGRSAVFDNSNEWYGKFASSFLKNGRTCYIGTNWQLPDSKTTLQFTQFFYERLFDGNSVGLSLQIARKYARDNFDLNDLTWASYLLIGNPNSQIISSGDKLPDIENSLLDSRHVLEKYPFPIALAYEKFYLQNKENNSDSVKLLSTLLGLSREIILFCAAIIFGNLKLLRIDHDTVFDQDDLHGTLESVYSALGKINALRTRPILPNLLEVMFLHRESLFKIIEWEKKLFENKNEKTKGEIESYEITGQYILETILLDLDPIRNFGFYRVMEPGHRQLSLQGLLVYHGMRDIILPTQTNISVFNEVNEKTTSLVGKCVFFSPIKRVFIDLSEYMVLKINHDAVSGNLYEINYISDNSK